MMPRSETILLASGSLSAQIQLPSDAVVHQCPVADSLSASQRIAAALRAPVGLPALHECAVPGDRVVVVIDPETPEWTEILEQVIQELQVLGHGGVSTTVLLPEDPSGQQWQQFTSRLNESVRNQAVVQIHDATDETLRGYLASCGSGERIYLNRLLLDADLIVSIGIIGFDGLLGYRGTSSVIYPNFSDTDAIRDTRGQGHPELTPDQRRPRRELVDEIGWLLGTQFAVQVLPGDDGDARVILAGMPDQVQHAGQSQLDQMWRVATDETFDVVVVSVPGGSQFGWKQLGNALEMACRIVQQGGRIVMVADVETPAGPGASMLRRCQEPDDLLKPLRREPPEDAVEITQLIQALRRARLYLLSNVPTEIVEELGLFSLTSADELQRLVDRGRSVAVIPGANFAWCDVMATR